MLQVSVGNAPAELKAAVLAMKRADADVRRGVAARMRETMTPAWRSEVSRHLTGLSMEAEMLTPGTRIAGGNPAQLVAASSRRKVGSGGGLIPDRNWAGYEYGSSRDNTSTVTNAKGTRFQRHTKRHLPARRRNGRVLGPAVQVFLPRAAAFWTQSVIRAFMDAADRKRG